MNKQQLDALEALHRAATPAPVQAVNLIHADHGGLMAPHEIGEYVANSVRVATGEAPSNFLAMLCQKHDGPADVCHFGNGPTSAANAAYAEALWNAAPALLAIAREHEQTQRDLAATREELKGKALLSMAVHETFDLIANSSGVAGLHLNGDEAPWDELLEGGEYEKWLRSLSQAKTWLDAESAEARKGVTPTTGAQR